MVESTRLKTPFAVTAYVRASSQDEPHSDENFATEAEARKMFDELKKDSSLFVYITEIGVFPDNNGTLKIDDMIFDTNDFDWWRSSSPLNRLGSRGFGRPANHGDYATPYEPVADLNWRL